MGEEEPGEALSVETLGHCQPTAGPREVTDRGLSTNTVKTHTRTRPRDAGTPKTDPQAYANNTQHTDQGHHPETQAHVCAHTTPDAPQPPGFPRKADGPRAPNYMEEHSLRHTTKTHTTLIHTQWVMRPDDRPRHTHGQLQGHWSSPRTTPIQPDPRNSLPLRCPGTCTETCGTPWHRHLPLRAHENTGTLPLAPRKVWSLCAGSRARAGSQLRWPGGRAALPTHSAAPPPLSSPPA